MHDLQTLAKPKDGPAPRWFHIAVAASMVISAIGALVATLGTGRAMERLVRANSFPLVVFSQSLRNNSAENIVLSLGLSSKGVGPARIDTLEIWVDGRPVSSVSELAGEFSRMNGGDGNSLKLRGDSVIGSIVAQNDEREFLNLELGGGERLVQSAVSFLSGTRSRTCYCSVLEECFVVDDRITPVRPQPVQHCTRPAVPFNDDLSRLMAKP